MTLTVNSKFHYYLWVTVIFCAIFAAGFIIAFIIALTNYLNPGSVIIAVVLLPLIYFAIKVIIGSLLKITVTPDGLKFKYLVTGKQTIINYADIVHVENVHEKSLRSSSDEGSGVRLNIFLKNGDEYVIPEDNYANYNELKEAIRRNRFHLDD